MELRERLKAWLAHFGWNQLQLAEKTGLSRAFISLLVGDGEKASKPSQDSLETIVEAMGLTMTRFYGTVPKPKKPAKKAKPVTKARASA